MLKYAKGGEMLEINFNKLDNDFITLSCMQLVQNNTDDSKIPITALAEMGQINAIQNYYEIKRFYEKNEYIDKQIEKFISTKNKNFNHYIAIANVYLAEKGYSVDKLIKLIEKQKKKLFVDVVFEFSETIRNEMDKLKILQDDYSRLPSTQALAEAKKRCFELYKKLRNPIFLLNYVELDLKDPMQKIGLKTKLCLTLCKFELKKWFKLNPTNIPVQYSLAKVLTMPKSLILNTDKEQKFGYDILTSLANRPLSSSLQKYIELRKFEEKDTIIK